VTGLRLCLLAGESLAAWQAETLARAVAETDARVTRVVVDVSPGRSLAGTLRRAVELRAWGVVAAALAAERRLRGPIPEAERVALDDVPALADATRTTCVPRVHDGWKHEIPAEAVDDAAREADAGLLFGVGFVVGRVLSAFDHGVLSFHHGDVREYRGQPMGFWEYLDGEARAGVTLQRLSETLDGGRVVATDTVPVGDAARWRDVRSRLLAASPPLLATGLRRVADPSFEPTTPDDLGDLHTLPRGRAVGRFVARTLRRSL
jgi:hypothetical protein